MHNDITRANREYYDRNAERYEAASWYYFNPYKQRAVEAELDVCMTAIGKGTLRVFEIGPGTGYLLDKLLSRSSAAIHYTGIEHSDEMARILETRFKNRCAAFLIHRESVTPDSVASLLEGDEFDLIMGSSILHHLTDYAGVVERLSAALAPGGVLYVVREPVHRDEIRAAGPVTHVLERCFAGLNAILFMPAIRNRLWPGKVKAEDASGIAIHMYRDGVSMKVFDDLTRGAYRPLFKRKYNRRLSGWLSSLENRWLSRLRKDVYGNTLFAIAIQKQCRLKP